MNYRVYFPTLDLMAYAVIRDLSVDFDHGIESVRLRSTETAANGIRRAFPGCEIYDGERRIA